MAKDLTVPTTAFIEAARLTRSMTARPKTYVYVEDDIDKNFWRTILEQDDYLVSTE